MEHISKTFEKILFSEKVTKGKEFQDCKFIKCDFSNSTFMNSQFIDCTFEECNLSMMKIAGCSLTNAHFMACKILGVNFSECQDFLFSVNFDNCIIDYASFFGKKMPKTTFNESSLKAVNFTRTDLKSSKFTNSNLEGAVFDGTNLSSTDFTTASHFSIDPEQNNIQKASFSVHGLLGLLSKHKLKVIF